MKLGLPQFTYSKGLHDLGNGCYAWLQPDGSWGLSNAGLITDGSEAMLVDTLYDLNLTRDMLQAMKRVIPNEIGQIATVVNTHSNGDHCNGNILVNGAEVVATAATAASFAYESPQMMDQLLRDSEKLGQVGRYFKQCFGKFEFSGIERKPPTTLFEGRLKRAVGKKQIELIEVGPAHTAGDTIIHVIDTGIIFAGDILFIEGHPLMWAGPVANCIKACEIMLELEPKIVVPGHGPITDARGVIAVKEYFQYVASEARKHFDAGDDVLEAAKQMLAVGPYSNWNDAERMAANVAMIYREFRQEKTPPNMLELFGLMAQLSDLSNTKRTVLNEAR
jgi:glyoxylase-like metal-dependent hydrolase (beta-lactamase superfamily II)